MRLGRRALRMGVDLVYPPRCMACGGATASADGLCVSCWAGLRFITRPYCERLGTPFPVDFGPGLISPAAMADPPAFGRARAAALYDGVARDMVHRLKFGDRLELAKGMGRMMAAAGAELLAESDMIVPVPLHWVRRWTRRFNQAAELGKVISTVSGVPMAAQMLARVRATRTQVGLTRAQRRDNLQGAFHVPEAMLPGLSGQRVLLVDDVLTSAATTNAAARVLLRAGAGAVNVLTFARVAEEG